MMRFSTSAFSSLGKKIFMGVSGIMLCGFIVVHLIGNLTLLSPDRDPFNKYAHFLQGLGTAIYVAEIILGAIFLIHFIYAIMVTLGNWKARPIGYKVVTNFLAYILHTMARFNKIILKLDLLIFFFKC